VHKLVNQIEAARLTAELEKEKKKMRLQAEETKEQIALNMAIEIEEERLFLQVFNISIFISAIFIWAKLLLSVCTFRTVKFV
jgi:hypothetical protein